MPCRLIRNVAGHDTHFHWRINRGDGKQGKCVGDDGVP
jgi:hypothetical protein